MNLIAFALSSCLATTSIPPSLDNDFETALGTAGLSTDSARFDRGITRFFQESEFSNPLFEGCHENPWRTPYYTDMWKRQLRVTVGDPGETVSIAGRMLGLGTRRNLLGNPIQGAIDAAIKQNALKATLDSMKKRGLTIGALPDLSGVPGPAQEAAAVVLQVAMQTIGLRRAAIAEVPDYSKYFQRAVEGKIESNDPEQNQSDLSFYRKIDLRYMIAAGTDLVSAAKHAQVVAQTVDPKIKYKAVIRTYWGQIVLSGGSDDVYDNEPALLILDTGGKDSYIDGASNQSATNWLSIVIDTDGADRYLSAAALANTTVDKYADRGRVGLFGPGAALFGVSVLIDSSGDDLYRTHRPGLGSAFGGVAYLEDSTGNDVYDGYIQALGSGSFGIGVLEDWKGDDQYSVFNNGEGFGGVSGFGGLIDRGGKDTYTANDAVIDFPSPQTKEHNISMAQGAASGRRADYIDGHSLSGGIGILYDDYGDDRYVCGVFGQGVGYWEGTGILWDEAGNDSYLGQWYVQGASAHFGIGMLEDGSGDDQLDAKMNMAQGAGHDFGFGILLNEAGADTYNAPNLSLGAGNANGFGIFVDTAGDDKYQSSGTTLGRAAEAAKGSLRERALCLGLFMDMGGTDTYPDFATWAKQSARTANWTDRRTPARESQVGVFWDR